MAKVGPRKPLTKEERSKKKSIEFIERDLDRIFEDIGKVKSDISSMESVVGWLEEGEDVEGLKKSYESNIEEKKKELEKLENKRERLKERKEEKREDFIKSCKRRREFSSCIEEIAD